MAIYFSPFVASLDCIYDTIVLPVEIFHTLKSRRGGYAGCESTTDVVRGEYVIYCAKPRDTTACRVDVDGTSDSLLLFYMRL